MKNFILILLLLLFCSSILALSIRGVNISPNHQTLNNPSFREDGPFELSPERGRFALLYSIVEDKTVHFKLPVAQFAVPDLGYFNNNFVSLFAPGVSYIAIPGYLIGKQFGLAQVGTFATISLFALFNTFLIRSISIKLNVKPSLATLGSLTYLFATPAFTYAVTLYQHHISTFLILSSIYVLLKWNNIWSLALVWFLCAASIPVDYPNLFLMLPIGIYALGRIISLKITDNNLSLNIKPLRLMSLITMIFPIFFFLWFNQISYNNPLQFSGTVKQAQSIDANGNVIDKRSIQSTPLQSVADKQLPEAKKSAIGFFKTRNLLNGFITHITSLDRGTIIYTPVVLFGLIGAFLMYKKSSLLSVFIGIIGMDILLYSMWGDPWGGWAFGSRYLIPAYAILCILLSVALSRFYKNIFFIMPFLLILVYSVFVNTLGAITTSAIPPQVEVLALEQLSGKQEKYTYEKNIDFLNTTGSKSYLYNSLFHNYLSPQQYYFFLVTNILIVYLSIYLYFLYTQKKQYDN